MAGKAKEWQTNKDGSPETMGQRYTRLQTAFNAKALGVVGLTISSVVAFCDVASKHPVLEEAMKRVVTYGNPAATSEAIAYHAGNYAMITEGVAGLCLIIGAGFAAASACKAQAECRKAANAVDAFGENYRPGDNARTDARLAAKAAEQASGIERQLV
jgi:hypothetical protein